MATLATFGNFFLFPIACGPVGCVLVGSGHFAVGPTGVGASRFRSLGVGPFRVWQFQPDRFVLFFIFGKLSCSTVGFMPLGVRPLGFWHGYLDLLWLESLVWGLLEFDRLG